MVISLFDGHVFVLCIDIRADCGSAQQSVGISDKIKKIFSVTLKLRLLRYNKKQIEKSKYMEEIMRQKVSLHRFQRIQHFLFAGVAFLVLGVLVMSTFSKNVITRSRTEGGYTIVKNIDVTEIGEKKEFRFVLDEIGHAETLSFFINHHEVEVYVGDECVYSLKTSKKDVFVTSGGGWVMIPLYESDTGKEVRVMLTSLYKDYEADTPEFLIGSEIAVHNITLHRSMLALVLSLCVIFTGILLLCLAAYHSIKNIPKGRLYALGLMVISAGLWRISYDRVSCLFLKNQTVLLYTISIISLMLLALSMLNSLETDKKEKWAIRWCSCGYCVVYIFQLLLQIMGIADLRQTLKLVHITILISAAAFIINGIRQMLTPKEKRKKRREYGWLMGVGVIIDLLMYYFAASSFNMVFTLVAILCYSVLEGIRLLFEYVEQKNALEEMQIQLILSRTATMMSQIRSHFVFNVLNAISGMCKYDPMKADETVVRFARYLRNNINIMEKDENIPFVTDLKQLEDYVALEQVRFGDKIEFYTDIEIDDFMIPPLILQPVVENAIKHGVSKKKGDGSIILRTHEEGENIMITVEDDGVGFDMTELEKEKSVGVRNIRFRLEQLVHGTLEIQSEVGKGTLVTIIIPKEEHSCM